MGGTIRPSAFLSLFNQKLGCMSLILATAKASRNRQTDARRLTRRSRAGIRTEMWVSPSALILSGKLVRSGALSTTRRAKHGWHHPAWVAPSGHPIHSTHKRAKTTPIAKSLASGQTCANGTKKWSRLAPHQTRGRFHPERSWAGSDRPILAFRVRIISGLATLVRIAGRDEKDDRDPCCHKQSHGAGAQSPF